MTQAQTPSRQAAERTVYRLAAFFLVLHILILFSGFSVLTDAFQFPDVLRLPAAERLALFRDGQDVIVPAYWALTMSGFTQIFAAVFLALAMRPYSGGLVTLAIVFGTLTGLGQAFGFGRWAILIPYLAERMADPTLSNAGREMIGLIEGSFNRYAGMLVGEHLANIAMGFWLLFVGLGMRRSGVLDARLGLLVILSSPLLFLLASEQMGFASSLLDLITDFGLPLLAVIHFGLAWQLVRRKDLEPAPALGAGFVVVAIIAYGAMVAPVFMG